MKDLPKSKSVVKILMGVAAIAIFIAGCCGSKSSVKSKKFNLEDSKKITKAYVHKAAVELSKNLKSVKDEKERQKVVEKYIDPIRFYDDKSGYFYVYNYDCVNIAHAIQKDIQGKNLYDHKDAKGKYVIRELSAAAKKGGDYVEFYWVKPGDVGEKRKLGYVEPIPGSDYFVGSGVYLQ
jgi:signal transduction histidine kinase